MAIGERIRFFRNKMGVTQKYLGQVVGFPERSADVRMAQYEAGSRTPKEDLTKALAHALEVSPLALDIPDIDSYLVIIDGLHRDEAVTRLNRESKPDERPFDLPVFFPQIERPKILTMLGESNISTRPWKGIDYLVSLLNSRNLPGVSKEVTGLKRCMTL